MANSLRDRLRALFGAHEDSAGTVKEDVGSMLRKTIHYQWPIGLKVASLAAPWVATRITAQTASVSASQPMASRVIFTAERTCRVKEALFMQYVSSTTTTTQTMSWTLLLHKLGNHNNTTATLSGSISVTNFIGGLSSITAAATGVNSISYSCSRLVQNKASAPNKLLLSRTASKLQLHRGDQIMARVKKGAGAATNDSGAIFFGGVLKLSIEDE